MGANESTPRGSGPTPKFTKALQMAARVAKIPLCSSLLEYNEKLRPALEEIRGDTIYKLMHSLKRDEVYKYAMSHYKTIASDYLGKSKQNFSTPMVQFQGAECENFDFDGGGYRREFYSEFFYKCACDKDLFIGKPRKLVPNFIHARLDDFVALGVAIVESILNGDCGFPYLHPAVFQILIGNQDYHIYITVEDIPDASVSYIVQQVCNAKSDKELQTILIDAPQMDSVGWPPGKQYMKKDKDEIVQLLANWSTIECRRASIDKLRKGLEYLGFLDKVKDCALLEPLFVYLDEYTINKEYMEQVLLPSILKMRTDTKEQEQAKEFAIQLTRTLTDDDAKALFTFITGAFDPSIDREELVVKFNPKSSSKLPESRTCFKELIIPVGNKTLDEFKDSFTQGLSLTRKTIV